MAASATAQAAEGAACVRSSRRGRATSALMARGKAMTWIGSDLLKRYRRRASVYNVETSINSINTAKNGDKRRAATKCCCPPQTVNKVYFFDLCCKSLAEFRRPADGGRGSNRVFRRRVRRKTHFPGHKCASESECAQRPASPRKNACIFEKRVEVFRHAEAGSNKMLLPASDYRERRLMDPA